MALLKLKLKVSRDRKIVWLDMPAGPTQQGTAVDQLTVDPYTPEESRQPHLAVRLKLGGGPV